LCGESVRLARGEEVRKNIEVRQKSKRGGNSKKGVGLYTGKGRNSSGQAQEKIGTVATRVEGFVKKGGQHLSQPEKFTEKAGFQVQGGGIKGVNLGKSSSKDRV